jgi:hypothetical protein
MSFRVNTSDVSKVGATGNGGGPTVESRGRFLDTPAARRVVSGLDSGIRDGLPSLTANSSFAASRSVTVDRAIPQFA